MRKIVAVLFLFVFALPSVVRAETNFIVINNYIEPFWAQYLSAKLASLGWQVITREEARALGIMPSAILSISRRISSRWESFGFRFRHHGWWRPVRFRRFKVIASVAGKIVFPEGIGPSAIVTASGSAWAGGIDGWYYERYSFSELRMNAQKRAFDEFCKKLGRILSPPTSAEK